MTTSKQGLFYSKKCMGVDHIFRIYTNDKNHSFVATYSADLNKMQIDDYKTMYSPEAFIDLSQLCQELYNQFTDIKMTHPVS